MINAVQAKAPAGVSAWVGRVHQLVAEWRAECEPLLNSTAVPLRPERVCREISQALPPDGVVVSDTGHSGMWTGQMIEFTHPQQGFVRCAGSLGWDCPARWASNARCPIAR